MEVYFVRHGKTEWNERGLFQGRADIPLAPSGIAEARATGELVRERGLSFDRVYSSPLVRALRTAELVSGFPEHRIIRDERLCEMDFGVMDGTDYYHPDYPGCEAAGKPFGGFFEDPEHYEPPKGAESFFDLRARTGSFLNELTELSQNPEAPAHVLVAAHGWVIRMLFSQMLDIPLSSIREVKIPNGELSCFAFEDGGILRRSELKTYHPGTLQDIREGSEGSK